MRAVVGVLLVVTAAACGAAAQGEAVAQRGGFYAALGEADRALAGSAVQEALETLPSRQSRHWQNPASGAAGFVTPLRTFRIEGGHFCRDYQEAIMTAGGDLARESTACRRQADGRWIPVGGAG